MPRPLTGWHQIVSGDPGWDKGLQTSNQGVDRIIPEAMDFRVAPAVAAAVARVAMATGQARTEVEPEKIAEDTRRAIYEGELGRLSRSGL